MSRTCRCRSSALRMPVEYRTISIVALGEGPRRRDQSLRLPPGVRIVGSRRGTFGYGVSSSEIAPPQRLHEEEPERRDIAARTGPRSELALAQQVRLIRPDVVVA